MNPPAKSQITVALNRLPWALAAVCFLEVMSGSWAQQLRFANPLPSTQLLYSRVGLVMVNVLSPDGTIATNSSAQITLTLVGPGNYSNSVTNSATNGVAMFDLTSVTLKQTGLYNLAATSGSLNPVFQNFGVEETLMPPQGSMFVGAWLTNYPGMQTNLPALEQICGRTLALSLHYYSWNDNQLSSSSKFVNAVADDTTNNRIPLVSWHGTYLTNIVAGNEDTAITNAAKAIAGYQGPVLVRWFWEMNLLPRSNNTPAYLGYPADGSSPSSNQVALAQSNFVTAWKRIRQIFDANGACNVVWLWNPGDGNDSSPATNSAAGGYTDAFYPGDVYVDWVGLDAYNRQNDAFANTFTVDTKYSYAAMTNHGKPLLIGETGARSTNQIQFLDSAAGSLQTNFPQLCGLNYFDAPGNADAWSLTTQGATNGITEFSNFVNNVYMKARVPQQLSYSNFPGFNARVHIAPAVTTLPEAGLRVGVSVANIYSNTPTGSVAIYSDGNLMDSLPLSGGSNGYCQVQTRLNLTNPGSHWLVAVYSGDANNPAGQSWPVQVNVTSPPLSLQSIRMRGSEVTLIWSAVSNQMYQVQFTKDLMTPNWTDKGTAVLATNNTASAKFFPGTSLGFYRVLTFP